MNDKQYKEKGFLFSRGKWLATFKVLLNTAHKEFGGNFDIQTKLIEANHQEKWAVFKAKVIVHKDNKTYEYSGYGDSFKENTGAMVQSAYIRMAETRAIVRALRFATNIAEVGADELPPTKVQVNEKEVEEDIY